MGREHVSVGRIGWIRVAHEVLINQSVSQSINKMGQSGNQAIIAAYLHVRMLHMHMQTRQQISKRAADPAYREKVA